MFFLLSVSAENMSLQYVSSMYCVVMSGVGASGGGELCG